jgi:4-hydroxy-3-methylbut-2-enyl diphosphate reductase
MAQKTPTVSRASVLGYCFGVRRAVDMAVRAVDETPNRTIYTYGPLIHNPQALDYLAKRGIAIYEPSSQNSISRDATVIIRAHGVPPEVRLELEQSGVHILDATCPRVVASQKKAAEFSAAGYTVIVAGDKDHGEVAGIAGFAAGCIIVESPEDAERLVYGGGMQPHFPLQKAALIAQTTINRSEYDAIAAILLPAIADLQVCDTLCPAAIERQKALEELCPRVDGVLVIGGKDSANTRRLLLTAQKYFSCAARTPRHTSPAVFSKNCGSMDAVLVETPDEIPERFFSLARVGITAGASTPDEIIDAVEQRITARGARE